MLRRRTDLYSDKVVLHAWSGHGIKPDRVPYPQRVYAGREEVVADMKYFLRMLLVRRHACNVVQGVDAV